jgi:preprotein translocase subunit SecY
MIGAIFLGVVAILPIGLNAITKVNIALGGTTVLIVVGVALEITKQLESLIMVKNYKGFLE